MIKFRHKLGETIIKTTSVTPNADIIFQERKESIMKKTNTNKGLKKLIPAAGMLMLSAAMLGTSTFAWFTMNKTVSVTGMQVNTTVGSNLLISHDTTAGTSVNAEDTFKTSDTTAISALLEPVSTIDGKYSSRA